MSRRPTERTPTQGAAILVAEAIRESGLTQAEIGAACERSDKRISEMASLSHTRTMSLRDVVQAPPAFRRALVALLAAMDGGRVVDAAGPTTITHDRIQGSRMAQAASRTYADLLEALDDGLIDRAEACRLEPVLAELEALVAGIRARVGDAKASGVDAERRGLCA